MNLATIFNTMPILTTQRLRLRGLRRTDRDALYDYFKDPAIMHYSLGYHHQSLDDTDRYMDFIENAYANNWAGIWMITNPETDTVIGTIGFENWHPDFMRGEVGFSIHRKCWGNGLMHEALQAVVRYGFVTMGLNRIEAICHPDNKRSIRVLTKCKFRPEGYLYEYVKRRGVPIDVMMWSILAKEYQI